MDYKKAGVDIEAGYKSVELMKDAVKATFRPEVLGGIGGYSGAFSLSYVKLKLSIFNILIVASAAVKFEILNFPRKLVLIC